VLRGVGDGGAGERGEFLDAALALCQQFEQFEPHRARQRGADARQVLEHRAFGIGEV